jgi:membrane protease YdiL (CAAX protease family)
MKSRPGIAAGFVVMAALTSVLILALSTIGGALNRSSDGAYAPSRQSSELWPTILFVGYFVSGVCASFTEKREGRILWAAAAHFAIFCLWGSIVFPARDKAEAAFGGAMLLGAAIFIPSFFWLSLTQQKENEN